MAALIACRRNTDFSGRQLVGKTKKAAVRTSVGAKAFLPQEIDGHKTADEKKRNSHSDGREGLPKIRGDEVISELWNQRSVFRVVEQPIRRWPHEHVERGDERDIHKQSRPKRFRVETHFF